MLLQLKTVGGRRGVRVGTVLGLLLVPLLVAGVLLWGLWYPTDRLQNVQAAVVNNDEPVQVDGQLVPLGRLLAGNLIGSPKSQAENPNFKWVLTDKADAKKGLADGTYVTVVTIPKNFSRTATSASRGADAAEQARITVAPSERGRLLDHALSTVVTQAAVAVLNENLGTQYVGNVFVGLTELHGGISKAGRGASELHAGQSELAAGGKQLADGLTQLQSGTGELDAGAQQLATGSTGLAQGVGELADGARSIANGTTMLAHGDGTNQGLQGLAGGIAQYTGSINGVIGQVQQIGTAVIPTLTQVREAIATDAIPLPEGQNKEQVLAYLDQAITQAQQLTSSDPTVSQLAQLKQAGDQLTAGAQQAADAASSLAAGSTRLADGLTGLSGGADALAGGANQLAAGTATLQGNLPTLVTGAQQLASGQAKAATGASELARGLAEASAQIPNYSKKQSEKLAATMIAPVGAEADTADLFTGQGAPLFATLALWAGALGIFFVVAPLWRRTRQAALSSWRIALHSALPAAGMGAAQGLVTGTVMPLVLGTTLAQGAKFAGLSLLAGAVFAVILQGVVALFGNLGRFLALLCLFVVLTAGILATVPAALQLVSDFLPLQPLLTGLRAIYVADAGAGIAALQLALWGVLGYLLVVFATARERAKVTA